MSDEATSSQELLIERAGGVVTITLNRPARRNAITDEMWHDLATTAREIAASPDDRAVVLTGTGGAFSSGADLAVDPQQRRHPTAQMRLVNAACLAVHALPQPTIAKVDGIAAGAGMNLALACDLVVASERARFCEIFSRRGLSIDFGGSWILPRLVGMQRAKELTLLAEMLDAATAAEYGLVNRVVPADQLDTFVADWADRLAAGPPIAMALSKRLLANSFDATLEQAVEAEAAAQSVNFATRDTLEAITAFLEKREPRFEGR